MKKLILIFAILFLAFVPSITITTTYCVYAEEDSKNTVDKVTDNVNSQLDNIDFSKLEEYLNNLPETEKQFFGAKSFVSKLKKIITGEFSENSLNIFSAIINLVFENLLSFIPMLCVVIAVAVAFSLISSARPKLKKKSIGDIIHFACYGTIVIILITLVVKMLNLTTTTIGSIKTQMEIIFPLLLTMMTAIGGTVSVGVYQPAVALLSGTIVHIFTIILVPIFTFSLIFSILSNLTSNIKFEKFSSFFSSLFKWIIGCVFTIFMAFVSIQGITAGSIDGISIKTAKYAIKSSVPILGGYLSDGLNLIIASSVLIKNGIGACGLLVLFCTIISPIIQLLVFMFCLKLTAAILEPLTDSRISNFVHMLSKNVMLLIVLVLGVSFMYLILTGLVMCSANYL